MIVSVCKILLFKYDIENHSFNKCYITHKHIILNALKTSIWRVERVIILFCYFNCNSIIYIFVYISFVTFIILTLSLSFYHSNIRLYNIL